MSHSKDLPEQTARAQGLSPTPPSFYDRCFSWKRPLDLDLSPGLRLRRTQIRKNFGPELGDSRILEVGSGAAPQSLGFSGGTRFFVDVSRVQLRALQKLGLPCAVASGESLPFRDEYFDLIICTDVLEHIQNDFRCLQEIRRALPLGGRLLLTVPHRADYYGRSDVSAGHFRRYDSDELIVALSESFVIERVFPVWGKQWNRIENAATRLRLISPSLKVYEKMPVAVMRPLSALLYLLMKLDLRLTDFSEASSIGLLCRKRYNGNPTGPPLRD